MSDQTLDAVVNRVKEHPSTRDVVTVVWHAGEPLSAGIQFYERAFAAFKRDEPGRYQHIIQTNATLLTDEWCQFLKANDVTLGISLDGPKDVHDANRKTRAGRGTFDKVMQGIKLAREHGIHFSILSVITDASVGRIPELFEFYDQNHFLSVGLLLEEVEGVNKDSVLLNLEQAQVESFWANVLREATKHKIEVREISDMVPRLLGQDFENSQTRPGEIISVGHTGDFSTYSPELLDQSSSLYGNFVIGNVNNDSFMEAFRGAKNEVFLRDITTGVNKCRDECDYFDVCKGGYPSNKHFENGSFDSTEHAYCRKYFQARANALLGALKPA